MSLRPALPERHLNSDSREAVRAAMGLVATMVALVLSLLIASAKSSYDTQSSELTDVSSKAVLLDRVLAHYGPESKKARQEVRNSVVRVLDKMRQVDPTGAPQREPPSTDSEGLYDEIQALSPKDNVHRSIQAQALSIAIGLGQTRWLMYEQKANTVSIQLLIALIFWLTVLFISFGLFAPRNPTAFFALFVSALSVSGATLLILGMYTPYEGFIRLSDTPVRNALAQLGQ
jgi:hypothetical protein